MSVSLPVPPDAYEDVPLFCDPASRALLARIERIAPSEATVLLFGETGSGKERVTRQIHRQSRRSNGPFVAINCAALSDTLLESELFGHERGAFTGAVQRQAGWFEAANGGTLFLDEVGELSPNAQVKLLRVLQERTVSRIGSRTALPVDVRIIAATHVDLWERTKAGRFREDLYYRLRVVSLEIPPLRKRPGDILPLARHFIEKYRNRSQMSLAMLSANAEATLLAYDWPGNVRELESAIQRALLASPAGILKACNLGLDVPKRGPTAPADVSDALMRLRAHLTELLSLDVPDLYETVDKAIMLAAFDYAGRNQIQTADLLGISRSVVRTRLQRFGVIEGGYRRRRARRRSRGEGRG
ncbi:Sigma54-dependent transcriptional activator SfnR [Pararobbsia alpina]|uniref:sigma-54 interaction domain-containing protein n=1 Tax=Pararobbsia alpina TaxID=621374 RepID=UPI0039A464C6